MMEHTLTKKSLVGLQILRALAAASVVYLHLAPPLPFGNFGVDVFFVISGFVMAMVSDRGESPREFAINRISRIVPLYWLLTSGVLLLALLRPELLNSTTANIQNYLKSLFFVPYYKENGAMMPVLLVGWSLNYEMFFYCCIWGSMLFCREKALELATIFIALVYILASATVAPGLLKEFFGNKMLFEFLLGIGAYKIALYRPTAIPPVVALLVAATSFLLMAVLEKMNSAVLDSRLLYFGIPSFLLVCSACQAEPLLHGASTRVISKFVFVGNASYAIYLSHFYVIIGLKKLFFERHTMPVIVADSIMFITAVTLGTVLYKLVDERSHKFVKVRLSMLFLATEAKS